MAFNIEIALDPGSARSDIQAVTSDLAKAEAAGPRVGAAISGGLREVSDSAQRAKQSVANFDDGLVAARDDMAKFNQFLGGGNAALKAESDMLERIHGPLAKYTEDLVALEALLEKGTISASQFADQMVRVNKTYDSAQPRSNAGFDSTKPPDGSGLGSMLGTVGVGLSAGAVISGVKSLREANDAYHELENSVRKFADASGGVNETMVQQRELSVAIRADLTDSIALYDRVTQSTRNLYLTQQQQMDITQSLGLIAKESNVPLSEAEGVMKKFTLAADTGTFSMRMFRDLGMNMPQMLQAMADHFHTTIKGFEDMAVAGKISAHDIALAIAEELLRAQAKIGEFTKTSKEEFKEFAFALADAGAAQKKFVDDATGASGFLLLVEQFKQANNAARMVTDSITLMNDSFAITKKAIADLFDDKLRQDLKSYTNGIGAIRVELAATLAEQAKFAAMPNMGSTDAGFANKLSDRIATLKAQLLVAENSGSDATLKHLEADQKYAEQVRQLTIDEHNQALGADGMKAAHEALIEVEKKHSNQLKKLESDEEKLADRLVKQAEAFEHSIKALDFAAPRLSLMLYNEELERLIKSYHSEDFAKVFASLQLDLSKQKARDKTGATPATSPLAGLGPASYATDTFLAGDSAGLPTKSLDADIASYDKARTAVKAYEDAVFDIKIGSGTIEEHNAELKKLRDSLNDMKSPQEVFAQGVKDATEKLAAHIYTLDAFEKKMRQLREAAGTGTFADGLADGMEKVRKEVNGLATDVSTTLTSAFGGLNEKMADLITTGKADWGALASQIERDLVKMSLHSIEKSAFDALSPAVGSTATAAAIGTAMTVGGASAAADFVASFTAGAIEFSAEFIAAGTAVASEIAAAMALGGVPHLATGGAFTPTGTDTVPFMAMVSPGERIIVQTPAQQRQAAQQGGAPTVVNNYHYHDHGDPRGLPALQQEMRDLREMVQRSRRDRS